ncbi:MAG TPA: aspartate aminotransferase family protein [Pseudolabrys sp.]|nr:aspartate aminotransferase family protein [Pseudolabrys sp.]
MDASKKAADLSAQTVEYPAHGGPVQLFYMKRGTWRRPTISHGEGIYMWDTEGRRYIDASSGPVATNIGHGNKRVIAAMMAQANKITFANRNVFENEPNIALANTITALAGKGFERAFFVSGGSEANEAAIKLARHYAVVSGQASRWKVIARDPSFHGTSVGAMAVTGDPVAEKVYGAIAKMMPKVPAPFRYRLPPNHDETSYARSCAQALEDQILKEGQETVLAFIMEPVGGLATGALVAVDEYYTAIRKICDRHGVLLVYDEVMSGAGRTGTFLAADHWPDGRPDIVTLAKGVAAGYTPMGAVLASAEMVESLANAGGFMHGHTYAANPLSCAIGDAVLQEMIDKDMMANAARMGKHLRRRLEELKSRSPIVGDVRGKGLLMAIEIVADKETKAILPAEHQAVYRLMQLGMERGLLLYSRRTANGLHGEWLMMSPPLIVTEEQVDEIVALLGETLDVFASELKRAGAIK